MKRSRLSRSVVSTFLLVAAMTLLLIWSGGNQASAVGESSAGVVVDDAGVDRTFSLGKFGIKFTPAFGGVTVTSPLLFDSSTTIGRSDRFDDGDATDTTVGASISCLGEPDCPGDGFLVEKVKDGDFAVVPLLDANPFDEGPLDTDEVHTQIIDLNMVDLGGEDSVVPGGSATAVRAGNSAPTAPRSTGEVEALTPPVPGVGEGEFPAESFFNVFVEVAIDGNGDGDLDDPQDVTVFNKATEPLLIENGELLAFPPKVIYVHGNTNAVKVFDKDNPATLVGHLIVAGHGIGFDFTDVDDVAAFNAAYEELEQNPMPIPAAGDITITSEASGSVTPTQIPGAAIGDSTTNGGFTITRSGANTTLGNGIDEVTTWTLDFTGDPGFPAFKACRGPLTSARLTLTMTPGTGIGTDGVSITGVGGIPRPGVQTLYDASPPDIFPDLPGDTRTITVDFLTSPLSAIANPAGAVAILGVFDAAVQGQIPMGYQDDAIISFARLELTCHVIGRGGIVGLLGDDESPAGASGSSSARDYIAPIVAAASVAAVLALTAGGWYARRRWLG